jgi:hypothetical protein
MQLPLPRDTKRLVHPAKSRRYHPSRLRRRSALQLRRQAADFSPMTADGGIRRGQEFAQPCLFHELPLQLEHESLYFLNRKRLPPAASGFSTRRFYLFDAHVLGNFLRTAWLNEQLSPSKPISTGRNIGR